MAKVSVIIPIYKVEAYLEKCIESVLAQTETDWEMILVDDGSPDHSGAICDAYAAKDMRIQVIHKQNGGLSDARNTGIEKATGTYLFFLDSDDHIHPRLLERTIDAAEQTRSDLVIFDIVSVESETGRQDVMEERLPRNQIMSLKEQPELLFANPSACNKLFRRAFWSASGVHFPVGRHYEDLATIPKLYGMSDRILYLGGEPLYYYMMREGSIMHGKQYQKNFEDRTRALDDLATYYKEKKLYEQCQQELAFLTFENGYFIPSKEIVLGDKESPYLQAFRTYIYERYPEIEKNPYIKGMSKKDRILYQLLRRKQYDAMILLSKLRKCADKLKQ
ncbi:MAG: glycosyltransferase [Hespellia sp.]|nr:glycosyltransferase [Hespellia sp.]